MTDFKSAYSSMMVSDKLLLILYPLQLYYAFIVRGILTVSKLYWQ